MVYLVAMTQIPSSEGGSPERILASTASEGEETLEQLHLEIYRKALQLLNGVNPQNPFEQIFADKSESRIVRRAVENLMETVPMPKRPIVLQSPQEIIERGGREEKIKKYIAEFSGDIMFNYGFRQIRIFFNSLGPYLEGTEEPKVDNGRV